ncbi:MAG: hypothetical protein ACPGTP_06190 [Bacteroidia bacterium]
MNKMTNLNERHIETLYYRADELINERKLAEAKEVLLELLAEDPTYAKAHNLLGWIYTHQLHNLVQADRHLKLAIEYGEGYAAPFVNYAVFLYEANKFSELIKHVDDSLYVIGVDRAYLLAFKGLALESKKLYKEALATFEEAKVFTFNVEYLNKLNTDKDRLYKKMGRIARIRALF